MSESQDIKALVEQNKILSGQVQELLDQNKSNDAPTVLRRNREQKVSICFIDGKAVIGFKNRGSKDAPISVYEKPNPNDKNKPLLFVDLVLQDTPSCLTVNYNEFLTQAESKECKVLKREDTEWSYDQGMVKHREVVDYSTFESDVMVPVEIVGKTTVFTVKLPDGEELKIHERYVNMKK